MVRILDLATWSRRQHHALFSQYELPFFNLSQPIDVTHAYRQSKARGVPFSLSCLYMSTRAGNLLEPFRLRIRGDQVVVHDQIHCGTTVFFDNKTFGFAYLDDHEDWATFCRKGQERLDAARQTLNMDPEDRRDDLLHHSIIPWVSFTSFQHARRLGQTDSIPKIVFGRFYEDGSRLMMPVSVEVHHALMDGWHVGQYFECLNQVQARL